MKREQQQKFFDEIKGYFEGNTTRLAEREHAHRASTYYDPAYLERERALLLTQPLIVAHSSQLKGPGDYLAQQDSGVPILLVRQTDGRLKAFLNLCRHRGAHVCADGTGNKKGFTCPYHAWTYRADGTLVGSPPGFPNTVPEQNGLVELPVEERHGLVWVVPTPGASIDVARHLGALDDELSGYPMQEFVLERDELRHEQINWKFVLDGFLEVYHIPTLHPGSIAPWFYGKYSPFDSLGLHSRLIGVRKSLHERRDQPFDEVEFLKHVAVNYQLFPNTIAVWQGDHFELWISYPGATPGVCTVRVMSLVHPSQLGPDFVKKWDRNWKVLIGTVAAEDWTISKEIQGSLPYIADQRLLFGRNEPGLQHFHGVLDDAIRALPKPGGTNGDRHD